MRAFVFTDEALAKHAGQFVWLSIDTEKAQNAAFQKAYPIRAWPSFYVIEPRKETVVLRWVGGATVAQLEKIFADGRRAASGGASAEKALSAADALYGKGDYAGAADAYRASLKTLSPKSPRYGRAVESLLFCYASLHRSAECVDLADTALPPLRGTAAEADLAAAGLDCALDLPAEAPDRAGRLARFETAARAVLANPKLRLGGDDRSSIYGSLVSAREGARDEAGARAMARAWVADLDALAAGVDTPEQRTALDPNRLGAYQAAKEIEKAIPMLERSERDFPEDYNPPARLGLVYKELKRYDEALAASDRALSRVYGPRRIRVLLLRSDIFQGMADGAAAKKALEDALAFAEALPPGQRSDSQIADLKKRLEGPAS